MITSPLGEGPHIGTEEYLRASGQGKCGGSITLATT